MAIDGATVAADEFLSRKLMVEMRYLSSAHKHNLAVSISFEQTGNTCSFICTNKRKHKVVLSRIYNVGESK